VASKRSTFQRRRESIYPPEKNSDGQYKTVANRIAWADAFRIPEVRAKASKHQKWFLEGALNDNGENVRIAELNLQFERYGIKYKMTPNAVINDARTAAQQTAPQPMQQAMPPSMPISNPYMHPYGYFPMDYQTPSVTPQDNAMANTAPPREPLQTRAKSIGILLVR
jgi:hypothetical protein